MNVKFKKLHPDAVTPTYAKAGDAGLDMTAIKMIVDEMYHEYRTGIAVEIPEGYVGLLFPRSSISKTKMILSNHVGVVDSGYRGEIRFRFRKLDTDHGSVYTPGDKIGQLVVIPYPTIQLEEVAELSDSERMDGGFGSSGN